MNATTLRTGAMALALAAALGGAAMQAQAAPIYLIDTTTDGAPLDPGFANYGFSLTYEDSNFDRLFSINELLAFTGVFDASSQYFDTLLGVPNAAGISGNAGDWVFGDSSGQLATYTAAAGSFTPFTTLLVPEPGSVGLVMAGLGLLGAASLRRRPAA